MTTTNTALLPKHVTKRINRLTKRADRWWTDFVFEPRLRDQLDPETMTVDEIKSVLRWRFPLASPFKFVRLSANATFRSGEYIYKVPVRPAAKKFCSYEAKVLSALSVEADIDVPRIKFIDVPFPISRYRFIPGVPLRTFISGKTDAPPELAHNIGRAIALLHSCRPRGIYRHSLAEQRHEMYRKVRKELSRDTRKGHLKRDFDKDTSFLDELDRERFVFCHGDLSSGNIIVTPDKADKIGFIDLGKACYNARESDFAFVRSTASNQLRRLGDRFFYAAVEAYEKHSGHTLDIDLVEKFRSLRGVLQSGRLARESDPRALAGSYAEA